MYDILVLEVITNGPEGYPDNEVVEIGLCGIEFETSRIDSIYSAVVRHDVSEWDDAKKDYATSFGVSLQRISEGTPLEDVRTLLWEKFDGTPVAAFDIRNAFSKYLVNQPWYMNGRAEIMPSVYSRLPPSLSCKVPAEENKCIRAAYKKLFEDDPMNVGSGESALDHALMTSVILLNLRKNGRY